ncbi:MAG: hypothetical protein ABIT37_17820 [Luteolibacter sp.]
MTGSKSSWARYLRYVLPILFIASVGGILATKHQINKEDVNLAIPSTSDKGRNARLLETQGKQERRADLAKSHGDFPIYKLPEGLRRIVSDFETRSLFMESPSGFTHETRRVAMDECRGIIDKLTSSEVVALIEYYRESATNKMPINGNEVVDVMLYEQWGKVDGRSAAAWIGAQLKATIEQSSTPVDLTDPFSMSSPDISTVVGVFRGWAAVNARDALSTWEQIHADLNLREGSALNIAELDNQVRSAIAKVSQGQPNYIKNVQQGVTPNN